ncbi:MAG: CotH kinase family protein [Paludibacter sp.]|nr:CotH kinase family protein [Paludibacter sp.]
MKTLFFLKKQFFVIFLILILQSISLHSQIVINEFSASNATQIEDPDYSDDADWIELYNKGNSSVNLKGYYLTDNFEKPSKWQITSSISIAAGGYLLIWADSKDSALHTSFNLSADGEEIGLYNSNFVLQDSISFTAQKSDISFGRRTDGSTSWGYFAISTPGASNNTSTAYTNLDCNVPEFTVKGGFFNTSISAGITSYLGGDIYYTTDGSDPELSSTKYTEPLNISATTILRARIFKTDYVPGTIVTASYFISENSVDAALPVVSIATNPANFWDSSIGIYVQSFKPDWEVPINIELFENNGSDRAAFNELAGCKINGLYSWQLPEKMLGIYFKKQYGSSSLGYSLINQRNRSSYSDFSLRASGDDWSETLFRDILGQQATLLNMNVDIMGFKPSILYVNGQYMGIHNIREKVDEDYITSSYGLAGDSFDMVENESYAENGNLVAYNNFLTLLNKDLSVTANYNAVAAVMDIEEFTDYVITEMCDGNFSIDHNVMAWKPKDSGKWRWILMDLDRGFETASKNLISFYTGESVLPLKELLTNTSYKAYFGKRLAAHLYTSFHPDRIKVLIAERKAAIDQEMPNHIARWKGTTSDYGDAIPSYSYWETEVQNLQTFADARPAALLADLKNYGFSSTATLSLSTYPSAAGTLKIDGLTIPASTWSGPFLMNLETTLSAVEKPGYSFLGWAANTTNTIIASGDSWNYLDTGVNLGTTWTSSDYVDTSWKSGKSQLGYGDGDETTTVSYGTSSSSKYITTYFRKKFTLTAADKKSNQFIVNLLKDDGAIVYLNGQEIIRTNMSSGTVNYNTTATTSISGTDESTFTSYTIDNSYFLEGENIIAVEVHQNAANSVDMSFDLKLTCLLPNTDSYISTSEDYNITLSTNTSLTAVYEATGQCIIHEEISGNLTLGIECSPYMAQGDITVKSGATLTIDPGVEIWMPKSANIFVNGVINANGTADKGISFKLNPNLTDSCWGIIKFKNTDAISTLKYVTIEKASKGPDLAIDIAAITAFNADLVLDHMTIENNYGCPIVGRYSDITLTNSSLHSDITGDNINVKYGHGYVANCKFRGNGIVDSDGIDFDEVENGVIRNCKISDFLGDNSDAIDLGEKDSNILIDSVTVCNLTDKGVSVGQQSSTTIKNSVFINCTKGIGVKDSSNVVVENCVFYGNVDAIACYEKNLGYAGGNAVVSNSILSNSSNLAFSVDSKSTLKSSYCLTDVSENAANSSTNITGNPLFTSPGFYNFNLLSSSPGIGAGMENGISINLGTLTNDSAFPPNVMISQFFINPENLDLPEFIGLYNPSDFTIDVSNYAIINGITATIPANTYLASHATMYLTIDATANNWWLSDKQIIGWEDGKLSNNGETIDLYDSYGHLVDFFTYSNDGFWPANGFTGNNVFQLITPELDNHFAESWETTTISEILDTAVTSADLFVLYPNPTKGSITINALNHENGNVYVYSMTGQLIMNSKLNGVGVGTLDLTGQTNGVYILKIGETAKKVVLMQ